MTAPERTASGGDGPTGRQLPPACDVLIVGGGPTGLFLACLLAACDVDVLVLERRAAPSAHSRGIGLHPPAIVALRSIGLDAAVVGAGARIRGGRARTRRRVLGGLRFDRAWPGCPFVLSLPQSRTEELLESRLAELAPGALRRGWEVTGLREGRDGVEVTARGAGGVGKADGADPADGTGTADRPDSARRIRVSARVVIGADGARSRVRELLGIPTAGAEYPDTYLMGDVVDTDDRAPDREAVIHLDPRGVVESFPLPGGGYRWVAHTGLIPFAPASANPAAVGSGTPAPTSAAHSAAAPPGAWPAASPAALADIIRARTGIRLDPAAITMISAFTVRRRTARRLLSGRCALIGDAAHEISPIGGQSITLGWVDALALLPLLRQVTRASAAGCALPASPAWRRWERTCVRRAEVAGRLAAVNTALGRPLPAPQAALRDLAVRLVLGTPLRRVLAWVYSMGWTRRN